MSKNVGQLNVKLTADTKPLEQGVDEAVDKLKDAQSEIEHTDTSSLDNLKNTITDVFGAMKSIASDIKGQWDSLRAPIDSVNDDMKNVYSTANMMKLPVIDFKNNLDELSKEQLEGLFDELTYEINDAKLSVADLKQTLSGLEKTKVNNNTIKELRNAINQSNVDIQTFKTKLSLVKNELNSIKSDNIKQIGDNLKNLGSIASNTGNKMSSSFKKGINSMKRFALGLIGVRTGINYLVQSMKTYINSSDTMTSKTAGISQALSQSLAPYAEIAVSALQKLVHWVIIAIAYFTTFINKIFGTKIAIGGMSKNMKVLTKNTNAAAKAAKNALAPFDEFNILQEDSSSDTGMGYVAPDFSGLGINKDDFAGITAFGDWLDDHKEIIQWLLITITAIVAIWTLWNVAVGIFNALMAMNPIVLLLMAAVAVIALIIVYWDDLKTAALAVLNAIGETISAVWNGLIKPIINAIWDTIKWVINSIITNVKLVLSIVIGIFAAVSDAIYNFATLAINIVKSIFQGIWNIIKTIFNGIKDFISKILKGDIKGAFESLKDTVINVFNIIWSTIKNIFSNIWNFIKGVASSIGDIFSSAIKGTVNAIIGFAEKTINGFIKAINVAIKIINAIPGVNIKKIDLLNIPRLASGTVATGPMVAEIGEYSGAKTNPEIVSPEDRIYANMVKALKDTQNDRPQGTSEVELTINVKYEDGKTIIKKINTAQDEAGKTLLEV